MAGGNIGEFGATKGVGDEGIYGEIGSSEKGSVLGLGKEVNLRYHHRLVVEYEEAPKENLQWKMEKEKRSHERKHHVRQIFYRLRDHKPDILFDVMDTQGRYNVWLWHQILWGDDGVWMRNISTQRLSNDHRWAVCEKASQKGFFL